MMANLKPHQRKLVQDPVFAKKTTNNRTAKKRPVVKATKQHLQNIAKQNLSRTKELMKRKDVPIDKKEKKNMLMMNIGDKRLAKKRGKSEATLDSKVTKKMQKRGISRFEAQQKVGDKLRAGRSPGLKRKFDSQRKKAEHVRSTLSKRFGMNKGGMIGASNPPAHKRKI